MSGAPTLFDTEPRCRCCGVVAAVKTCGPCRQGRHVDHHEGVWDYANPALRGRPVICRCPHT